MPQFLGFLHSRRPFPANQCGWKRLLTAPLFGNHFRSFADNASRRSFPCCRSKRRRRESGTRLPIPFAGSLADCGIASAMDGLWTDEGIKQGREIAQGKAACPWRISLSIPDGSRRADPWSRISRSRSQGRSCPPDRFNGFTSKSRHDKRRQGRSAVFQLVSLPPRLSRICFATRLVSTKPSFPIATASAYKEVAAFL